MGQAVLTGEFLYEFELAKAADKVVFDLLDVKEAEQVIITADTQSDPRVVNALARAVYAKDGKPLVMWMATPPGPARMADPFVPATCILGALQQADCWIELNRQYLNYSDISETAAKTNKKLRYLILPGLCVDIFIRLFANVDQYALADLVLKAAEKTFKATKVHMTSPSGTDVTFENEPKHGMRAETGFRRDPGMMNMNGQVTWLPKIGSVNGKIVIDGAIDPQFGLLDAPVELTMEKGEIIKIDGGNQARQFEEWVYKFQDKQMLRPAHVNYGLHPGAQLSGQIDEDERVWGCSVWGFGAIGSILLPPDGLTASTHYDCIIMNTSTWLDGIQIIDKGNIVDTEMNEIAKKLGK